MALRYNRKAVAQIREDMLRGLLYLRSVLFMESRQHEHLDFEFLLDREEDGRWIAEARNLPGVLAYGETREAAVKAAYTLALRVVADCIENEAVPLAG